MSDFSSGDTVTQTSAARLGLEERQLELTKFLMGDDPLGMVPRAHMHIEEELIKFIAARGHPEDKIPRGYALCVELALKLGLREEFKKQLSVLGRLRKPLGSTCRRKRRMNSAASSVMVLSRSRPLIR
jgi:hypothetical protein